MVFLTAGAAGMYCGSCMHDNALAKALRARNIDCILQPIYTPIRTDEESIASENVFFGGVHIYLLNRLPWLRFVPRGLRGILDRPRFIRWVTRKSRATDAAALGDLAISMLKGQHGNQADEVDRLVDWMAEEMRPDVIVLSNLLIGGSLPSIKERLPSVKVIVLLQGDDIFLDHLPEAARSEAIRLCSALAEHVDHFIVNSRFYGEKMASLLGLGDHHWIVHPLSIDLSPFDRAESAADQPSVGDPETAFIRIGYLARIAPEKGLHHLVDAFIELAGPSHRQPVELHVAGWLGEHNQAYFETLKSRIAEAGLTDRFVHHGSPSLDEKVSLLRSFDVLSVPTDYEDPKGLFLLEAAAAGVPVVQPDHGAFGELIESTGGGMTYACDRPDQLTETLIGLIDDPGWRQRLGDEAKRRVRAEHSIDRAAERLEQLF